MSLLFSVHLVPIFSQSLCAQPASPTSSTLVAADDQVKSRADVVPSLLRQRYTLGLEMSYPNSKSANFGSEIAIVEARQPITSADFSPDGSRVVLSVGAWDSDPAKSRGEVQIFQMAK